MLCYDFLKFWIFSSRFFDIWFFKREKHPKSEERPFWKNCQKNYIFVQNFPNVFRFVDLFKLRVENREKFYRKVVISDFLSLGLVLGSPLEWGEGVKNFQIMTLIKHFRIFRPHMQFFTIFPIQNLQRWA